MNNYLSISGILLLIGVTLWSVKQHHIQGSLLVALDQVHHLRAHRELAPFALGGAIIATLMLSAIAYVQIPTHTFYYDGQITQDAHHGSQELQCLVHCGLLSAT
jgi:hypothetical protein